MKGAAVITAFLLIVSLPALLCSQDAELIEELMPLEPFLGTWIGTFTHENAPQGIKDTVSYEIILGGKAVRSPHALNVGYAGETLYMWDEQTSRIKFWYFTNIGEYSEGDVTFEGDTIHFVANHYGGTTSAWRAAAVVTGPDSYTTTVEYFTNGKWQPARIMEYQRTAKTE